ncbi:MULTISPECIES: peptidoglycan recognition family protein [unclassified Spirillospora]|uniref:peptidoglycan recognition protein family protein n=1 Tax=unclassified Spirillospora TaxID=2642701 RepID=UPI00371C42D2
MLIAHSGDGADGRERCGPPVTRRSLIGGVVGAGLLEALAMGSSVQNAAMADELSAGPGSMAGEHVAFKADAPHVYTRAQWNARRPRRPAKVLDRPPDRIIVHHTATANSGDRSLGHAFALSRFIQDFHMDKNGWDDTGQQLTISRGGIVMEGRNRSLKAVRAGDLAVGAQVLHHNGHTIGIENEGTYTKKAVPGRLWDSLVEVCVWLCQSYDLDPSEAIVGHRDYNSTACPGDVLYARLPKLRRAVAGRLDGSPSSGGGPGGQEMPVFPPFDDFG